MAPTSRTPEQVVAEALDGGYHETRLPEAIVLALDEEGWIRSAGERFRQHFPAPGALPQMCVCGHDAALHDPESHVCRDPKCDCRSARWRTVA